MLVLTRRIGESIIIGKNIRVMLLSMKGGEAKLAFEAPREIEILREELLSEDFILEKNSNNDKIEEILK